MIALLVFLLGLLMIAMLPTIFCAPSKHCKCNYSGAVCYFCGLEQDLLRIKMIPVLLIICFFVGVLE
jgi:hypothetical protein